MNVYGELSDQLLLDKMKQDDAQAFAVLYDRYWPALWRYACNAMNTREEAKDIVQEVFFSLWERRKTVMVHTALSPYLYRVTMNKVIDNIDRTRRHESFYNELAKRYETGVNTTESVVFEKELVRSFEEGLTHIPRKARQVFELSRNNDMTHQQISEELSISRETVKSQLKVALKILKGRMLNLMFLFY